MTEDREKKGPSDGRGLLIALSLAACGVVATAVWAYCHWWGGTKEEIEPIALLGDIVGPAAAVLNALALFAAIWSVQMQRRELQYQREEMRENREVMERHAKHAEALMHTQRRANKIAREGHSLHAALSVAEARRMQIELGVRKGALASSEAIAIDIALQELDEEIKRFKAGAMKILREAEDEFPHPKGKSRMVNG